MIYIYSESVSARMQYVFRTVFSDWLNIRHRLVTDEKEWKRWTGARLAYSVEKPQVENIFWVKKHPFMDEIGWKECKIDIEGKGKKTRLFPGEGDLEFDVFAGIFYLLSRYEEYQLDEEKTDEHGRFLVEKSLAFEHGFLEIPIVDYWLLKLRKELHAFFPALILKKPKASLQVTVDVDNAYAFYGKNLKRTLGACAKAFFKGKWDEAGDRLRAFRNKEKDPYNTYDWQIEICKKYNYPLLYFMLFTNPGKNNRSLPTDSPAMIDLVQKLAQGTELGIHPSYQSSIQTNLIQKEIVELSKAANQKITKSRQHYIRLKWPETIRELYQEGIREEYSMGYANKAGFRASVARSFCFFDLENDREMDMRLYPFPFLDTFYAEKEQMAVHQAYEAMMPFIDHYKEVGGELVLVWHDRTFSEYEERWMGWRQLFEMLLKNF